MSMYDDVVKRRRERDKETEKKSVSSMYDIAFNKRKAGIDTIEQDYSNLASNLSKAYSGWQTPETMSNLSSSVDDMKGRLTAYGRWARYTGNENADSITKLATRFESVPSTISDLSKAYSGYKNKTAFDSAVRIEREKESAKKYHTEADYEKRIQELTEERSKLKGMDTVPLYNAIQSLKKLKTDFAKNPNSKYEAFRDAEDFEEKSKAVEGRGGNTTANQQMYKFINNPVVPKKSDNPDIQRINEANLRNNRYNKVTDEEKALYNYLYNSGRYEEAEDYINNLGLSSRVLEAQKDYATEQYRNMNGLQRTLASLVMIPANIGLSAYNGVVDLANMATGGNLTGNDVYEGFKTIGQGAEQAASIPHDVQSQIMSEKFGTAGQIGYEAVYSALNSLAGVSALGHGFEVVMGLGAAHDTYNELSQTDTPMAQTIIKSLSAGVLEALFEHLPTETLLQMSKNTTSLRQLVANLLKVGAEEGLEEAGTEASNNIVDLIVGQISEAMGGENTSKLKGAFDEYVARGYSAPEAKEMVFKDVLQNVTTAGVTGALSGMLMGGSSAIDLGINNSVGKQVIHPEALAEVAKTYGSDFADYVAKLQSNPTNAEKGAIYRQISDKVDASTLNLIGKWTEGKEDTDLENKVVSARANVEKSVTKTEADEQREGDKRSDAEIVQSMGSEYAEDVQKVFTDNYEGQNPYEYKALFDLAYENGARATGLSDVLTSQNISSDAIKNIYKAGVSSRSVVESKLNEITKDFSKLHIKKGMGRFDDSAVDTGKLTKAQKETVALLHAFSDKMGVNITLYQSTAEEQRSGKPNGFYDPKANTIHVDVNAGLGGTKIQEAIIIPTVSHEITHWSKTKALDLYNKLSESVFDALYEADGISADARIEAEKERLLKNEGIEADDDYARDEVVARACEDMLKNSKTVDKYLKKMNAKELSTFKEKVAEIFDSIIEFFHELASAFSSEKAEAIAIRQMEDKAKKLQKQWDAMLDKAIQINKGQMTDAQLLSAADEEILAEAGLQYDEKSQSFSSSDVQNGWRSLEDETMSTSEYLTNRDKVAGVIAKQMSKLNGTTIEEEMKKAQDYINDIAVTYMFYKANISTLDFVPSEGRSTIVSNSEYGFSFDTNTECAKRRIFTGTFTEIQKLLGNRVITADEVLQIRQMLLDRDLQATCGLCYVEGSRVHMGEYNEVFLKKYAATNPPYVPTMYEVNTPDGNEELRLNHPEAYEALEFFYNHGGRINKAEVDKKVESLFSSQAKPKMYTLRTEYKGEIRDLFTIKKGKNQGKVDEKKVANKNKNGGGRFQSFSDFEIVHLLDVMQAIADCSYVGLGGQAYTKVESFAKVFGDTNLKINLSLIAKDVDKNGNLIFDDREGINSKNAFEIRENHSKNVGTVIVIFNDEQLKSALKDSRIDYVLPFHRSQWSKAQYGLMGLPKDTKEYTAWQNESYIKDTSGNQIVEHLTKTGKVRKRPENFMPNEYWDYSKNGRVNAETYLKMCADDGRLPKFSFLLVDNGDNTYSLPDGEIGDNYFKLLIDFKMYDNEGNGSPQLPMIPNFNMDETMRLLKEYEGGHNSFPVAQEVVDEFVKDKTPVKYSSRDTSEIESDYSSALESKNMDKMRELVREYAVAQGYDRVGYHGTDRFGFTAFDMNEMDDKMSIFIAGTPRLAKTYSGVAGVHPLREKREDISNLPPEEIVRLVNEKEGTNYEIRSKDELDNDINYLQNAINTLGADIINTAHDDKYNMSNTSRDLLTRIGEMTQELANKDMTSEEYQDTMERRRKALISLRDDASSTLFLYLEGALGINGERFTMYPYYLYGLKNTRNNDELYISKEYELGVYGIDSLLFDYNEPRIQGNMEVAFKLNNPFVVDAYGRNWNELPVLKRDNSEDYYKPTTRGYAEYAHEHGYDGVIFNDIKDIGRYGDDFFRDSVYVVFNPTHVKSLDAVTYDDNGDPIPLHLRFDNAFNELRYSSRDLEGYGFDMNDDVEAFFAPRDLDYDIADADDAVDRIIAENKALGADIEILNSIANRSYMKAEERYAKGVAKYIIDKYGSKADEEEISKAVKRFYNVLLKGNADVIDIFNLGGEIATKILDGSEKFSELKSDEVADYIKSDMKRAVIIDMYTRMWNGVKFPNTDTKKAVDKTIERGNKALEKANAKYEEDIKAIKEQHNERIAKLREYYKDKAKESKASITKHYKDLLAKTKDDLRKKYKTDLNETVAKKVGKVKEAQARKIALAKVVKNVRELSDMLVKNNKKKRVNDALKPIVKEILDMVDMESNYIINSKSNKSIAKAFDKLRHVIVDEFEGDVAGDVERLFGDADLEFKNDIIVYANSLLDIEKAMEGKSLDINAMDARHLEELANMLTYVRKAINQTNRLFGMRRRQMVEDVATDLDKDVKQYTRSGLKSKVEGIANFFDYSMALPYYAFKRLGNTGSEIFKTFMDAWDKFAFNVSDIIDTTQKKYKDLGISDKDIRNWKNDTHNVSAVDKYGNAFTFKATSAQLMSLYCLSRREAAWQHLESHRGGFHITTTKANGQQNGLHVMSHDDIAEMCLKELNDKQIRIAEFFQEEMSTTGSKLGNEVTLERWGISKYLEKFYFPMKTENKDLSDTSMESKNSIFRLLNASFTNDLNRNAQNGLEIGDIFEVYSSHMSDMAKYNALALPTLNLFRVWNYKEEGHNIVKNDIENAFGEGMNHYIQQFLEDINGASSGGFEYTDNFAKKMLRNYKIAAVGGNIRVALLQPTAYVRASYVIPSRYLTMALKDVAHVKEYAERAQANSGIAKWKSLGYYDTNVASGVTSKISGGGSVIDNTLEKSGFLAEKGDEWTWGMLYHACELEAKDKGLKDYAAQDYVNDRFREIVYQTQVVDSTMTRTQAMRSKSTLMQMVTAFMTEPMQSFNMLTDGFYEYEKDKQLYGRDVAFKRNGKKIAKAFGTYLVTLMCASLVGALPDWVRDEDREYTIADYLELVRDNALQDAFSMIPYVKDAVSLAQGYSLTRMDEQYMATTLSAVKQLTNGELNYKDVYSTAKAVSQITGIPISNVIRSVRSIYDTFADASQMWNDSVGETYPSMKVK